MEEARNCICCNVQNCAYNDDCRCTAKKVDVGPQYCACTEPVPEVPEMLCLVPCNTPANRPQKRGKACYRPRSRSAEAQQTRRGPGDQSAEAR